MTQWVDLKGGVGTRTIGRRVAFTNVQPARPFAELATARKEELGLSFRELARRTQELAEDGRGLSAAYLVQLLNGNEHPVPRTLELIAPALDLSADSFVEFRLHAARQLLDERVDFDRAVENLVSLGLETSDRVNREPPSRAGGRRRQSVAA